MATLTACTSLSSTTTSRAHTFSGQTATRNVVCQSSSHIGVKHGGTMSGYIPQIEAARRKQSVTRSFSRKLSSPRYTSGRTQPLTRSRTFTGLNSSSQTQKLPRHATFGSIHPLLRPLRLCPLVEFRDGSVEAEDDGERERGRGEKSAIEIGVGSVQVSLPLSEPFRKPVTLTRVPTRARCPTGSLALSVAVSLQFALNFHLSPRHEVSVPVALSLSLSFCALSFLTGVYTASPSSAAPESNLDVSLGDASASIPLSLPMNALPHIHQLRPLSHFLSMSCHHLPHALPILGFN